MAEKGFSQPKGGKPALKSPASKGKDDSSVKSKRGRKVQFDSEESLDNNFTNSNGKADQPSSKGDSGKGGKGDKVGSGGKSQTTKAPAPLELRVEQELPDNTICLVDCEAAEILQGIQDQMVVLSEDPAIKLPPSFDRGLTYALRHRLYDNPQTVKQILKYPCPILLKKEKMKNFCLHVIVVSLKYSITGFHLTQISPLKEHGVSDGELCMIANLHLESADEVFALVPSLKAKKSKLRDPLKNVLVELAKLRNSA